MHYISRVMKILYNMIDESCFKGPPRGHHMRTSTDLISLSILIYTNITVFKMVILLLLLFIFVNI